MKKIYKVVLIGLDFAGKTSILKVIEGSYSGLDQIAPTVGTDRTSWDILGFNVINWDLGGQKQYRDKYMANFEHILDETNLIIFVIDMQDDTRFNEAGAYFDDILHALDHLKLKCPLIICLHKVDPDILDSAPMITNLNWVTNLFSEYSQKHDIEIKVFITSIFNRKSLIEMFSYGLGKLMPIGILNQILDEFLHSTENLGALGFILFDEKFLTIGNAFSDLNNKAIAYRTINTLTTLTHDFKGVFEDDTRVNFNLSIGNGDIYNFKLYKITELDTPYHLLIMGKEFESIISTFRKEYVPKINKALQDLIESID